jgi:hypothetical protein
MGLVEQIQRDIQSIRGNKSDFGVDITLTAPTSPLTVAVITGTTKKHHTIMDEMGMPARNKANVINATCTVPTLSLDAVDYPYRTAGNRVSFKNHIVSWADIATTWTYKVEEWYPNEQTGEIVLILGFYNGAD